MVQLWTAVCRGLVACRHHQRPRYRRGLTTTDGATSPSQLGWGGGVCHCRNGRWPACRLLAALIRCPLSAFVAQAQAFTLFMGDGYSRSLAQGVAGCRLTSVSFEPNMIMHEHHWTVLDCSLWLGDLSQWVSPRAAVHAQTVWCVV